MGSRPIGCVCNLPIKKVLKVLVLGAFAVFLFAPCNIFESH
jgi:hypothetical protein